MARIEKSSHIPQKPIQQRYGKKGEKKWDTHISNPKLKQMSLKISGASKRAFGQLD
jgi:hypothetical protein